MARDICGERGKACITLETRTLANVGVADRRGGDDVTLSVKDNGSDMAPEIHDQLFDAYFITKPAGEGTGWGWRKCDGAVRQADGYIGVQSVPGQGACGTLGLPAAEPPGA
ncbi:ATP-binding protein [Xanthomonas arboricola]|uniref:ATP-binding protein n=1 Tax=Xanthomonas arboricola TaxID=56448 RepID=UPI00209C6997|nr:ATP-binding protein [Xanthomonas arboricola]